MLGHTELKLYIDGEGIGTEKRRTHGLLNPATGGSLGELPRVDPADRRAARDPKTGPKDWRPVSSPRRSTT